MWPWMKDSVLKGTWSKLGVCRGADAFLTATIMSLRSNSPKREGGVVSCYLISPRRACTRGLWHLLCVWVSVCLSVCLLLLYCIHFYAKNQGKSYFIMFFNLWIFIKMIHSKVVVPRPFRNKQERKGLGKCLYIPLKVYREGWNATLSVK